MKPIVVTVLLTAVLVLSGCGTTARARQASGTALGAGVGAIIGSLTANAGQGALLGAAIGSLGGVLMDEYRTGGFGP
ncbi:YMGG-like glycine zipper-containing protein [Lamprocystis purpurea]|uniref:YMGG-like glycine zipper-containing protein n=1 Tax=Lamprocystis purpurea TaxID=61598 RepID=UPI00035F96AA|nr:YMGG-like glycine zipper-containing protein [Lamprocystis purpurea]